MEIVEIVNKIVQLSKKHMLKHEQSIYKCFCNDKNDALNIIKNMKDYLKNIPYLTDNMKIFHMLGFLPRTGKNIYPCACILYWYIKIINPSIKMYVLPDGSIEGFIPSNNRSNKEHIILQAHMDIVDLNPFDSEKQHYGPYGKNPNVQFYHSGTDSGLWINKNNLESVLGADDGKGIAEIINLIQYITNNAFNNKITWPNITFLLTTIEEMPFGKSMIDFCSNKINLEHLFPKELDTKLYINLDSYCGTQIDTYDGLDIKAKELEKQIIDEYKIFVENDLKAKSTQQMNWNNPPSEALILQRSIKEMYRCNDICFISMNADSIHPHSNNENIDLIKFDKFCNWFNKKICYNK